MKNYTICLTILVLACNSQEKNEKETWKTENYINETQILLTNNYKIGGSFSEGASAFLIESKKRGSLLCTAKHLLGKDMGISPEITTNMFNTKLNYWSAYPRTNKLSDDTLSITGIINKEINSTDIILLEYRNPEQISNIQVLKPRFTNLTKGETLEIIGCEYSDYTCHQKIYKTEMDEYDFSNGMIIIKSQEKFVASGFSGAPVVDENGFAVGVVSGGGEFEGEFFIWIEPLEKVRQWLE